MGGTSEQRDDEEGVTNDITGVGKCTWLSCGGTTYTKQAPKFSVWTAIPPASGPTNGAGLVNDGVSATCGKERQPICIGYAASSVSVQGIPKMEI